MNIHPFIQSEIGTLQMVLIHTPGPEVENMTPENAERALYSDILNLSVASGEYHQFAGIIEKVTHTLQVKDALKASLQSASVKNMLIDQVCTAENCENIAPELSSLTHSQLADALIEGVELKKNNLTNYLSQDRYAVRPLHNFFFTRDASFVMDERVFISKMARRVRERESLIMQAIFQYHWGDTKNIVTCDQFNHTPSLSFEGGDILIIRDDITLMGNSVRTTASGIDFVVEQILATKNKHHVIVQQLPDSPESFIHLDMVFTMLSPHECLVYEPIITHPTRYQTLLITIENHRVQKIEPKGCLLQCLKELGIDLRPISCGGSKDRWMQDREQWHSGANFFAFAPGKVIGYSRNHHTLEEMNQNGFEIISATDFTSGKKNHSDYPKCVITFEGSELARGGGGARCMTLPISREKVDW